LKASEFLESNGIGIETRLDARKEKIGPKAAMSLVSGTGEVWAIKGNKKRIFDPGKDDPAEMLAAIIGPTGNLRVPTLRIGDRLVVGFHEGVYSQLLL
jgi:hypothetical protein